MKGILFLSGLGIRRGYEVQGASIVGMAPTVLALMGVPIPEAMDGRVLEAAMTDDLRQELTITYTHGEDVGPEEHLVPEISAEDGKETLKAERVQRLAVRPIHASRHGRGDPVGSDGCLSGRGFCIPDQRDQQRGGSDQCSGPALCPPQRRP